METELDDWFQMFYWLLASCFALTWGMGFGVVSYMNIWIRLSYGFGFVVVKSSDNVSDGLCWFRVKVGVFQLSENR